MSLQLVKYQSVVFSCNICLRRKSFDHADLDWDNIYVCRVSESLSVDHVFSSEQEIVRAVVLGAFDSLALFKFQTVFHHCRNMLIRHFDSHSNSFTNLYIDLTRVETRQRRADHSIFVQDWPQSFTLQCHHIPLAVDPISEHVHSYTAVIGPKTKPRLFKVINLKLIFIQDDLKPKCFRWLYSEFSLDLKFLKLDRSVEYCNTAFTCNNRIEFQLVIKLNSVAIRSPSKRQLL